MLLWTPDPAETAPGGDMWLDAETIAIIQERGDQDEQANETPTTSAETTSAEGSGSVHASLAPRSGDNVDAEHDSGTDTDAGTDEESGRSEARATSTALTTPPSASSATAVHDEL